MELIDVYDENRQKTGKVVERFNYDWQENEFSLSVQIWIINSENKIIVTRRADKFVYPLYWECTEGIVDAGETSLEAAIREVKEEIGITLYPEEIIKLNIPSSIENPRYVDVYYCRKDIPLEDIILQEDECIDVKIIDEKEYDEMCKKKEMIPYLNYFYKELRKQELK